MYKTLFGPVCSRRLKMSLGINISGERICPLDCVYCEAGKTDQRTLKRKEYVSADLVKAELADFFENYPDPDYYSFSGSGEPTLNSAIGQIIRFIKLNRPNVPVAVLTNGTLLFNEHVRESIQDADFVLPSLDAATDKVFQKINRPVKGLDIDTYIQGLVDFSHTFKGKIWLEILILPGYNDSREELNEIKKAVAKIQPDLVQLNTLDRPGVEQDLRAATTNELQKIKDFFAMENVQIIASSNV